MGGQPMQNSSRSCPQLVKRPGYPHRTPNLPIGGDLDWRWPLLPGCRMAWWGGADRLVRPAPGCSIRLEHRGLENSRRPSAAVLVGVASQFVLGAVAGLALCGPAAK